MLTLLLSLAQAAPDPTPLTDTFSCRTVGAMVGPEDYAVVDLGGRPGLLVSASRYREGDQGESDGVFALDPESGETRRMPVLERDACSLHPHGVDLRVRPEGIELYAVVHFREEDTQNPACKLQSSDGEPLLDAVERYRLTLEGLVFQERIQGPLFTSPNDLTVQEDGSFFVSNNPDFTPFGLVRGVLLGWRPSQVLSYAPGEGLSVVARRFFYSNGVLVDDRGDLLVGSYGGKLTRLTRGEDGWEKEEVIRLQGALDNLMLGQDGQLWIAGHPSALGFSRHAKDASEIGPSVAWALKRAGETWEPTLGYLDESGAVQASSTAAMLGRQLVFAQVFQPGLVICDPR